MKETPLTRRRSQCLFLAVLTFTVTILMVEILAPGNLFKEITSSGFFGYFGAPKTILMWTPFFADRDFLVFEMNALNCPSIKGYPFCQLTYNRTLIQSADAILFHSANVELEDFPPKRGLNSPQLWLYLNQESPVHKEEVTAMKNLLPQINWTITYRTSSTFYSAYGKLAPYLKRNRHVLTEKDHQEERQFYKKQTVAWLVSHCRTPSKREEYVLELIKHIAVDIYGRCGDPIDFCPENDLLQCYKELAKRYKFYLSFENAICRDYVSEKFFMALEAGMVPVVLGGVGHERLAPTGSFLDVFDFDSAKDLANFLKLLSNNYTLYKKYLNWKKSYFVEFSNNHNRWMCDVCRSLYEANLNTSNGLYDWWVNEAQCQDVHQLQCKPKKTIENFEQYTFKSNE